jgi:hypothetical protein
MVAKTPSPLQGGMKGSPHHEGPSLNAAIFMCDQMVNFQNQAKYYDISKPSHAAPEATSSSHPGGPLHSEKPPFNALLHPLKGFLQA